MQALCLYHCDVRTETTMWVIFRLAFNLMRVTMLENVTRSWALGRCVSYVFTAVILAGFGLNRWYFKNDVYVVPLVWLPYLALSMTFFYRGSTASFNKRMALAERRAARDMTPFLALFIFIVTLNIILLYMQSQARLVVKSPIISLSVTAVFASIQVSSPTPDCPLLSAKFGLVGWAGHPSSRCGVRLRGLARRPCSSCGGST
jgi:hypothetical protein